MKQQKKTCNSLKKTPSCFSVSPGFRIQTHKETCRTTPDTGNSSLTRPVCHYSLFVFVCLQSWMGRSSPSGGVFAKQRVRFPPQGGVFGRKSSACRPMARHRRFRLTAELNAMIVVPYYFVPSFFSLAIGMLRLL